MSQTNFYIITRDHQIFEIPYTNERISLAVQTMRDKGIFMIKDYGAVINGVDIVKILDENQYDNYLSSHTPKEYVKCGIWRDGKEHKILRYEKWKKEELDNKQKLEPPVTENVVDEENLKRRIREFAENAKKGIFIKN